MADTPGAQLRAARLAAGLHQTHVADRLGVSQSTVSRWENDEDPPLAAQRSALHALFGLDPVIWERPEDREVIRSARALRREVERKRRAHAN